MSRRYLTILQLADFVEQRQLRHAYRASRARYQRLTARGPLRFYRRQLLTDVERAYHALTAGAERLSAENHSSGNDKNPFCPSGAAARRAARLNTALQEKVSLRSAGMKNCPASSQALPLRSRSLSHLRQQAAEQDQDRQRALIEDEFCREVIYRLEGDLIRFQSRRELLQIASEKGIHLFQANMLMAQIVEAVRQHKLYLPTTAEKKETHAQRLNRETRGSVITGSGPKKTGRFRIIPIGTAAMVLLAVVIDLLLIRYLQR